MRRLLRIVLGGICVGMVLGVELLAAPAGPNVLFIVLDDLNDWVGAFGGHPQVRTPHMDALAARGVLFSNAHCQSPLCNPTRTSVMTGLRPSTTGVYGLAPGLRDVAALKEHVTLPQAFTDSGYYTYTCGKVYHDGALRGADRLREFGEWGPAPGMSRPERKFVQTPDPNPLVDWGVYPERDEDQADWEIAGAAVSALQGAPKDRPFFIACGFRLPHVPCYASQGWFDLYSEEDLQMPPVLVGDRDDTPLFSWYLHWRLPEPRLRFLEEAGEWRNLVRSYLACVSFVDSQVGRVLDALERSGRAKDTMVVLWSDHGFHLGEKLITGKNTLWERSTRVPLIIAGPGVVKGGRCEQPVELLDLFPTLLESCGFAARTDLEGHSLVPQLRDPQVARPWPAITTHNQGNHAVRTLDWRYIRYADGSEELYDLRNDPNEWHNLAGKAGMEERRQELAKWLPQTDVAPVPGSRHRVLRYDPETGVATWEGEVIGEDDPIPEMND